MELTPGSGSVEKDPEVMIDINTTPLIDVMLVLLIMLIVTIPIQTHAIRTALPVPQSSKQIGLPPVVNIDVGSDGAFSWNGTRLSDRKSLEGKLSEAARSIAVPEVHIHADPQAAYRHVAAVLASAQRLGITQLGVVVNK